MEGTRHEMDVEQEAGTSACEWNATSSPCSTRVLAGCGGSSAESLIVGPAEFTGVR